jgi:hypothetical protein
VLLGNGDGSFQSPVFYPQNVAGLSAYTTLVIADFNNDGKLDFAIPTGNQSLAVLLGNGDGTFGSPAYFFDGAANAIASADFNGDGKLDIAAAASNGLAILLGNGDGTFQPAAFPVPGAFGLIADLNGDGKVDIVSDQVYLGNGDGTFRALGVQLPLGVSVLADINGDGKLDAIGGRQRSSQSGDRGFSLGNGDGTFGPYIVVPPFGLETQFTPAADMNGDGKQDLIAVDGETGSIFVLINTTIPVPVANFSPASVAFPSQTVGTSSNPTPVTLTNTGAVTLTVSSVTIGGANAGQFKQNNNCTTVQPLASCKINVAFAPTSAGGASANLIVADNAGSGSQEVAVSGTGADFTNSAAALSPASIPAGGSATTTVTITSVGGFSQSVALACGSITLNGSPATMDPPTCKFSPSSVSNASGTSTLTVGTTGQSAARAPVFPRPLLFYAMLLPILGITMMRKGFRGSKKKLVVVLLVCVISSLMFLAACGGGNSSGTGGGGTGGTPAGTYTISISGSAGSMVKTTQVMLTVQ